MKIVFIKDIPKVAKKGEARIVADGYGAHLIKSGAATLAGSMVAVKVEQEKVKKNAQKVKTADEFKDMAYKLKNLEIKIKGKISSGTHLFKGIRVEDIADAVERASGIILSPHSIKVDKPIKETGEYTVAVVQGTMHAELKVQIVGE